MKSFKNYMKLNEYHDNSSMRLGNELDAGINPVALANPAVLKRLNAYVGTIGNQEYLLPEHALHILRSRLMRVGLGMEDPPVMEGKSGSFDLPLNKFGGRFGKDGNTPYDEFLNDDGISHIIEGGLTLKVSYEMMPKNNSCKLYASIV